MNNHVVYFGHENINATYLFAEEYVIVSTTLPGDETLKYPPFHGICFFDEIFSSFLI